MNSSAVGRAVVAQYTTIAVCANSKNAFVIQALGSRTVDALFEEKDWLTSVVGETPAKV